MIQEEEIKTEIKNLEDFKKGYKAGFADGYMEAMKEVFKMQEKMDKEIMTTPGVQPRPGIWW